MMGRNPPSSAVFLLALRVENVAPVGGDAGKFLLASGNKDQRCSQAADVSGGAHRLIFRVVRILLKY